MKTYLLVHSVFCVLVMNLNLAYGQTEELLINPSFEGEPSVGRAIDDYKLIDGWEDWDLFESQTPPDVHGRRTKYWNVQRQPQDGNCYVGLTTRANRTWECFGQKLRDPLKVGEQYVLTLYLCRDYRYASQVRDLNTAVDPKSEMVLFDSPTIVRIWGSNTVASLDELLDQSEPVTHEDWKQYTFNLQPSKNIRYIVIEAYYPANTKPGNGHVLIDNAALWKSE